MNGFFGLVARLFGITAILFAFSSAAAPNARGWVLGRPQLQPRARHSATPKPTRTATPSPTSTATPVPTPPPSTPTPVPPPATPAVTPSPTPSPIPTITPTPGPTPAPGAGVPMKANDFLNSLGVTSHMVQHYDTESQV